MIGPESEGNIVLRNVGKLFANGYGVTAWNALIFIFLSV